MEEESCGDVEKLEPLPNLDDCSETYYSTATSDMDSEEDDGLGELPLFIGGLHFRQGSNRDCSSVSNASFSAFSDRLEEDEESHLDGAGMDVDSSKDTSDEGVNQTEQLGSRSRKRPSPCQGEHGDSGNLSALEPAPAALHRARKLPTTLKVRWHHHFQIQEQ